MLLRLPTTSGEAVRDLLTQSVVSFDFDKLLALSLGIRTRIAESSTKYEVPTTSSTQIEEMFTSDKHSEFRLKSETSFGNPAHSDARSTSQ